MEFRVIPQCVDKSWPTIWKSSEFSQCYSVSNTI